MASPVLALPSPVALAVTATAFLPSSSSGQLLPPSQNPRCLSPVSLAMSFLLGAVISPPSALPSLPHLPFLQILLDVVLQ